MATGGAEKSCVPDYDECPVCRDCLKDPRTLDCGHYFCKACLERIEKETPLGPIKCPTCREVTELPQGSGVTDLPRHEGKYSFQDQVTDFLSRVRRPGVTKPCDLCGDLKVMATDHCYQCRLNLCQDCLAKHDQKSPTHKTVPIVDSLFCTVHVNEVIVQYCHDCETGICAFCVYKDHVDHQTIDIGDVAKPSRLRLKDFLHEHSLVNKDQNTLAVIEARIEDARKQESEFKDYVEGIRKLIKELEAKLDQVESDTKAKMAAEIKTLTLHQSDIKDIIVSRQNLVEHATYLANRASDPELVEQERDFPVKQGVPLFHNLSVEQPVLDKTFLAISAQLQQIIDNCKVDFRKLKLENKQNTEKLDISDYKKEHTVSVGHITYGITIDQQRRRIVARTVDVSGPLKVYNYQGQLQESLGAGVPGLGKCDHRGICIDTNRNYYVVPCQNTLVLVNRAGQQVKSITVGSDNTGVAYHKAGDCYLVSDTDNHTVSIINAQTTQVTRQFGCKGSGFAQLDRPFNLHVGTVTGIDNPCILVSNFGNNCIKLFDVVGTHIKTYGQPGSGDKQLNYPWSVCTDSRGRVVVCDRENNRVVSYWTDTTGQERWECVRGNDWGGNKPWHLALDPDNTMMAIMDGTLNTLHIYK